MGILEDYLNSLEGQESLDAHEVARNMHELHNQEISTREAKIAELETEKGGLADTLTAKDQEILGWKAKNYDLAMQLPGAVMPNVADKANDGLPPASDITFDDFFTEKKD